MASYCGNLFVFYFGDQFPARQKDRFGLLDVNDASVDGGVVLLHLLLTDLIVWNHRRCAVSRYRHFDATQSDYAVFAFADVFPDFR